MAYRFDRSVASVTLKWRMRASGLALPGFCPGGAEVVRRLASHNFGGSHDEIQIKIQVQNLDSLGCANDPQIQVSLSTFIIQDLNAARHQARAHSCDAADTGRRYDRRDHDGHGMAAAFGTRFSRRCGAQETRS